MVRLSTRGRYATRMLVYMALRDGEGPCRKQDIARAEGISVDYVGQILMKLKTAGLTASQRGAGGGFVLSRNPASITVADVIEATEGPIALVPCVEGDACNRATVCVTQDVWREASRTLRSELEKTTIKVLADRVSRLGRKDALSFDI